MTTSRALRTVGPFDTLNAKYFVRWNCLATRDENSVPRLQLQSAPFLTRSSLQASYGSTLRSSAQAHQPAHQQARSFTVTLALRKKGGKAAREESRQQPSKTSNPITTANDDPFDLTTLETDIASTLDRLKESLSKLRAGGRFNPETIENLRVHTDKTTTQTAKLSDVAQVIPKGRTVQILVGEREHVKPTTSAIQSSSLNLTPQPDPTGANPLLLVVNIPPPTAESRRAVFAEAIRVGEKAGVGVRDARGRQQKRLRGMQLEKSVRPDDLKRAGGNMEKGVERATAEIKRIVDGAKKGLESG